LRQAFLAALLLGALKAEDGACTNGMCADVPFAQPPVELSIIQPRHGEIVRKHEAGLSIAFQGRPMPARSHTPPRWHSRRTTRCVFPVRVSAHG